MLADMSPEEFEERWAHYRVEPWGDWSLWFARMCAILHNGFVNLMAAATLSVPDESMYRTEAYYMPGGDKESQPQKRRLTDAEAEAVDRARYRR
jgi:hypothetical protein